ncbi:MAG TPA: 5-formyltetrahydrofolate cyclo-ligase [Nitrospira sp.]|nr:5-formyltetrahydrofolate cyclo-ligase [Nitrospira sp.]
MTADSERAVPRHKTRRAVGKTPSTAFRSKMAARQAVWDRLQRERLARFPFPPHRRIPNFAGAAQAAARLFEQSPWRKARRLKINPDAPQRPVREEALKRGISVYVPTPRLRAGFLLLDPSRIPRDKIREAAALSTGRRWGRPVPLNELPQMDAIVCGSVAVTANGLRCGKGEGYSDLEYAALLELGHRPVPVATTVHDVQIVGGFPRDRHDLPVSLIVTPAKTLRVLRPPKGPAGIDWKALTKEDLDRMPILKELRARSSHPRRRIPGGQSIPTRRA